MGPSHKNNFTAITDCGPSGMWADCPYEEVRSGQHPGYAREWRAADLKTSTNINAAEAYWGADLMVFGSNGAVVTAAGLPYAYTTTVAQNSFGAKSLGSDGDDEGAAVRQASAPFRISGPNSTVSSRTGALWLEGRIKVSSIADTLFDFFFGLMEDVACTAVIPITATAGRMADKNLVGFLRLGSDGDYLDAIYKADGQPSSTTHTTAQADAQVLVADNFVKIGLKYNPVDYTIKWYGNGKQVAAYTVLSTQGNPFPNDINLGWVMGCTNVAGSITDTFTWEWVRACQIPLAI